MSDIEHKNIENEAVCPFCGKEHWFDVEDEGNSGSYYCDHCGKEFEWEAEEITSYLFSTKIPGEEEHSDILDSGLCERKPEYPKPYPENTNNETQKQPPDQDTFNQDDEFSRT